MPGYPSLSTQERMSATPDKLLLPASKATPGEERASRLTPRLTPQTRQQQLKKKILVTAIKDIKLL